MYLEVLEPASRIAIITASLIGAATFIFNVCQLRRNAEQACTTFEDLLNKEYRELMRLIPYKALVGDELDEPKEFEPSKEVVYNSIYNYLDFCNAQIFLRKNRRIRESTWLEWQDGMKSNLSLPLFQEVTQEVFRKLPEDIFEGIRKVQKHDFETDPAKWQ